MESVATWWRSAGRTTCGVLPPAGATCNKRFRHDAGQRDIVESLGSILLRRRRPRRVLTAPTSRVRVNDSVPVGR